MTRARLPVIGSSASATAFCSVRVDLPPHVADDIGTESHLFLDGNGKITAGNGTLEHPSPNAFSLVQVEDCPQSTPTCRKACYVHNLADTQPDLHALYQHNSREIRRILASSPLADSWAVAMAAEIRRRAPGGFRWHVSGDVFSLEYAEWIADVCRESSDVPYWMYTRSFAFLAPLAEVSTLRGGNLALNLSCDRDNAEEAYNAAWEHGVGTGRGEEGDRRLRLCYLATEPDEQIPPRTEACVLDQDDVIFPDYHLRPRAVATLAEAPWWQSISQFQRGLVCPVDAHGKDEKRRCGPCRRCLE